ncbi:MAG: YidC/Oxa1 family membrane protein insertase [Candidatus Gracilibacteria bacterium]
MFKKDFLITFVFAFGLALLINYFLFPAKPAAPVVTVSSGQLLMIETSKKEYGYGENIELKLKTGSGGQVVTLPSECPEEPFDVYKNGQKVTAATTYACEKTPYSIPSTGITVNYAPWYKELFKDAGNYSIKVTLAGEVYEAPFTIKDEGFFGSIWNTLFNRPLYNLLILFTTWAGNDLGWGIVILTLLIKFILLIPTQKMLESQKEMQKIQPKLKALQEKYKDDKQRISQETMALMKEHKVNPLGSCLPLLIQLPILIALYFAVQHGLNLSSTVFLYEPLKSVNIEALNPIFLGLINLANAGNIVLALIVGLLQFIQMKISFAANGTQKTPPKVVKENGDPAMPDMSQMNTYMTYVFPVMIFFVCISAPSAIGLYFVVSTIFAIIQQYFVNKEKYKAV